MMAGVSSDRTEEVHFAIEAAMQGEKKVSRRPHLGRFRVSAAETF
jgi:hypothetical protein